MRSLFLVVTMHPNGKDYTFYSAPMIGTPALTIFLFLNVSDVRKQELESHFTGWSQYSCANFECDSFIFCSKLQWWVSPLDNLGGVLRGEFFKWGASRKEDRENKIYELSTIIANLKNPNTNSYSYSLQLLILLQNCWRHILPFSNFWNWMLNGFCF